MIEEANNVGKLENYGVEGVSKNARRWSYWFILKWWTQSRQSLLRGMLNFMFEKARDGKKGSKMLQLVNPTQLDKSLNDPATMGKS